METSLKALKRHYARLGLSLFAYLTVTVLAQWTAGSLVGALAPAWLEQDWFLLAASFAPMYLIGFPVFLCLLPKPPLETAARQRMPWKDFFVFLVMCFGILYPCNLLGAGVTGLLGRLLGRAPVNPVAQLAASTNLGLYFLFAVVLAPIMEELTFRKLLIDRLRTIDKPAAVLFSALAFGLFHGNLSQVFYAFGVGLLFGFIYVKTGRLRYTIALHMLVNFFGSMATMLLLEGIDPEALDLLEGGVAQAPDGLMAALPALLGLGAYCLCLLAAAVAGVYLLIKHRRRFRLADETDRLTPKQRWTVALRNGGTALYLLAALALFALNML